MVKDILQQNENATPNSKQLAVLKEHFPACFNADGTFDLERFKAEIAANTQVAQEGYELKFLGKSYAKLLASTDTTTVIQPNEAHNSLPENANSENIYISGDNLDGLKHLLKSYNGAVKCIYIDPPYNTGSDGFVFADNFNYTRESLQEKLSVSEEEAERILDLTKRGSASHSAWLMFMYSRLLLARDLLSDDGVIFISIDDNEQANLKLLCDDVFGEENFVAMVANINNPKGRSDDKFIATAHEYIAIYSRNVNNLTIYGFEPDEKITKRYNKADANGLEYREIDLRKTGDNDLREDRPNLFYYFLFNEKTGEFYPTMDQAVPDGFIQIKPIRQDNKEGNWRWAFDTAKENMDKLIVKYMPNRQIWGVFEMDYLEGRDLVKPTSSWTFKDVNSERGSETFINLGFDKRTFPKPKPVGTIRRTLEMCSNSNQHDIILDFFSGSGTTAHAIMQLNADDGGKRRFISIQLPEVLSPDVDSQKTAYEFLKENNLPTTLDYIGIERIKRAAAKIREEQAKKQKETEGELFETEAAPTLDLGFRHYILQEPNQNTLDKLDSFDKAGMLADTTILDDFGKPTILATWLNADGYGLTAKAQAIDLAGYTSWYCQKHLYLIDPGFTLESMKALLRQYDAEGHFNPENMVLFGYSFPDWSINEMIEKNLRILNDGEKNLKINFSVRY